MVTVDAALEFIGRKVTAPESEMIHSWPWSGSALPTIRTWLLKRTSQPMQGQEEERFKHFYGEITGMDRAFGKLRSEVEKLGIKDNTILWYCSDNGGLPGPGSAPGDGISREKSMKADFGFRLSWNGPAILNPRGHLRFPL